MKRRYKWLLFAVLLATFVSVTNTLVTVRVGTGKHQFTLRGGHLYVYFVDKPRHRFWRTGLSCEPARTLDALKQNSRALGRYLLYPLWLQVESRDSTAFCIRFPLWMIVFGALALLVLSVGIFKLCFTGARHGVCACCGYDLRGAASPRCSECGTEIEDWPNFG
jgi:hypothetical protein